jgi:hypothetical protein
MPGNHVFRQFIYVVCAWIFLIGVLFVAVFILRKRFSWCAMLCDAIEFSLAGYDLKEKSVLVLGLFNIVISMAAAVNAFFKSH